jgi:hypothetical protein
MVPLYVKDREILDAAGGEAGQVCGGHAKIAP